MSIGIRIQDNNTIFLGTQDETYDGNGGVLIPVNNMYYGNEVLVQWFANGVELDTVYGNRKVLFDKTGTAVDLDPIGEFGTLQALVDTMDAGSWKQIPNTNPSTSVNGFRTVDEIRAIEDANPGCDDMWGQAGTRSLMTAEGGAAWDGKKLYFTGGGHFDYGGNEIYAFDFSVEDLSLGWERVSEPFPLTTPWPVIPENDPLVPSTCRLPTDGPSPAHTWCKWVYNPDNNSLIRVGQDLNGYCSDYYHPYTGRALLWEFLLDTKQWRSFPYVRTDQDGASDQGSAAYDTILNEVVFWNKQSWGVNRTGPVVYDSDGTLLRQGSTNDPNSSPINMVFNPNDGYMYFGDSVTNKMVRWDSTTDPATRDVTQLASVPQELLDENNDIAFRWTEGGFALNETDNTILVWAGFRNTWLYDITADTWTQHTNLNGTDPTTLEKHIYTKWAYISEVDAYVGCSLGDEDLWVYKMQGSGTPGLEFAEIPEQVFVAGYTEAADMNIYTLDTENLYPTGIMPWEGPSGFTPAKTASIEFDGGAPTGVAWDGATGVLTYDGTALPGANQIVTARLRSGTEVSDDFEIKLLEPTLEWAYSDANESFNTAVLAAISANTRTENVILVKDGVYEGAQMRDDIQNGYLTCFGSADNAYVIGAPGTMPVLSGERTVWSEYPDKDDGNWVSRLAYRFPSATHVYNKRIGLRYAELQTSEVAYAALDNVKVFLHPGGRDGWTYNALPDNPGTDYKFFVSNFETYHFGSGELKHPIYGESTDHYSDVPTGFSGRSFLNNYKAWETKAPGDIWGGHVYKDISDFVSIRNSWFSLAKDPTTPNFDRVGRKAISLHAHQRAILFNNDLHFYSDSVLDNGGVNYSLLFQPRNMPSALGTMKPHYFSSPSMRTSTLNAREKSGYGCWENWAGSDIYSGDWVSTKNLTFHGDNSLTNYSATGTKEDLTPNPVPPVDAPFWDGLGVISDPTNDNTLYKFISHCRFHTIATPNPAINNKALTSRTTAPVSFQSSGLGNRDFLPVPPNWIERTWVFSCNNTFDGFSENALQDTYETDFVEPKSAYVYPHSRSDTAASTINNITHAGGDMLDGVGTHITVPDWFRI